MLEVQNKNNILVVDSRLVAEELGITHKSFKETVRDNLDELIEAFGQTSLESAPCITSNQVETYYLLNEEQATFLMTLSRNTEQVKKAKLNLVKAFSKAKQALTNNSTELNNTLVNLTTIVLQQQEQLNMLANRTLQLDNVLAEKTELDNKLNKIKDAGLSHKGCYNILQAEISKEDTRLFTAFDYLQDIQKPTCNAKLVARRAATLFRCDRKAEPFKNKQNQLLFEKKYLDEAVTSIADLLIEE